MKKGILPIIFASIGIFATTYSTSNPSEFKPNSAIVKAIGRANYANFSSALATDKQKGLLTKEAVEHYLQLAKTMQERRKKVLDKLHSSIKMDVATIVAPPLLMYALQKSGYISDFPLLGLLAGSATVLVTRAIYAALRKTVTRLHTQGKPIIADLEQLLANTS